MTILYIILAFFLQVVGRCGSNMPASGKVPGFLLREFLPLVFGKS